MHVHFIVPDLFGPVAAAEPQSAAPATPALETLLGRGRKSTRPVDSFEAWLLQQFQARDHAMPASAPFALAGDGGDPGEQGWVHADPVHLRVERDHLVLLEPEPRLDRAAADALIATLNSRFAAHELRLIASTPERWYAAVDTAAPAAMTPLAAVRGRNITAHLPQGEGGKQWQRLMTEVQMVLHEHPVNAAREARGQPPINSVWFSGFGSIAPVQTPRIDLLCSTSPLARGLARAAGIDSRDLPASFATIVGNARSAQGVLWCVVDTLQGPVGYRDRARWADALAALERDWFAPMLAALRARQLGMLTLHAFGPGSALTVETTATDLRYLWRRCRPLLSYVNADHPQ